MRKLKGLLLNLGLTGLALASTLAACEVALRMTVPDETHYYVMSPKMRARLDPDSTIIAGVKGPGLYEVNSVGIRGDEFDNARPEYRILAIGGSTTELRYIDQRRTWTYLVQAALRSAAPGRGVWVGNVGRSGMNTRDHVVQLKHLSDEYRTLAGVIVLTGVNDLTLALHDGGHYVLPASIAEPEAEREQVRRAFQVAPGSLAHPASEAALAAGAPWFKATALYQLLKRGKSALAASGRTRLLTEDTRGEAVRRWRDNRAHARRLHDTLPDLTMPLVEYRRNLEAMLDLAAARHLRLVFLTQPALWRADLTPAEAGRLWLGGIGDFQTGPGHEYYSVAALASGMRQFNQAMLEVCAARHAECLALDRLVPKDSAMFYDDVHFTDAGSRVVAQAVSAFLLGGQ